ncbi:MAG: HAD-IIA family hydrolase [Pseudanabaenaceae cyanobacterium bins.39]|nr:HAD-IIA family hydrolase [Pseudanabaenaceae cyanobacterium bins.39]
MDLQSLLEQQSCFVIDLDGVVYKGREMIAGADRAIATFREWGKQIVFLTNNSASSTLAVAQKLQNLGIECDLHEILTAASASATFIAEQRIDEGRGVLTIGTEALKEELVLQGLQIADADHCGAILVGLDPQFHYDAIAIALRALRNGAKFVACNRDANFPIAGGQYLPGCGAMVAAIEAAAEQSVDFEVGKPQTTMLTIITQRLHIPLHQCLVIGDMLASDILMANKANIPSIWISDRAPSHQQIAQPSFWMPSLLAIAQAYNVY